MTSAEHTGTMSDLKNLIHRRSGHRSQATVLINSLSAKISEQTVDRDEVKIYAEELRRQRDNIMEFDKLIHSELGEDKLTEDISKASECIIKINLMINKVNASTNTTTSFEQPVKLPNIKLGKFAGDPLSWVKFWDLYKASIHDRSDLSKAAKFHYLISQLDGEAATLLSGFDQSADQYDEALDLLKTTYGKHRLLVQARLNAIFDLPPPIATTKSLGDFRSQYESHLRSLKSLGANIEDSGYVFAELLLRKLPNSTRDNINRATKGSSWTLVDLRAAISTEIEHLRSVEDIQQIQGSNVRNIDNLDLQTASFQVSSETFILRVDFVKPMIIRASRVRIIILHIVDAREQKLLNSALIVCELIT